MKNLIALGALLIALSISSFGCIERPQLVIKTFPESDVRLVETTPPPDPLTTSSLPTESNQGSSITASQNEPPPSNQTWISPGKVEIGNFYPGAQADWFVQVHNGKSVDTQFSITYREPSYTATGFSKVPNFNLVWLKISEPNPILKPYETRSIPITLMVPAKEKINLKAWEFWVSVIDSSQKGQIRTELCSRWLIKMR